MPAVRSNHHFYPRPPRGGRQVDRFGFPCGYVISIHALREEGDGSKVPQSLCHLHFYPRPPRGGRLVDIFKRHAPNEFLSTPSARRATVSVLNAITDLDVFLSTPSARRATLSIGAICCARCYFYPRPPRGGRPRSWTSTTAMPNFYPRPPRGGRRGMPDLLLVQGGISIHALREEGDPEGICLLVQGVQFLSTPSARRATSHRRCCRAGLGYFYPRPPRGGRRSALGVHSGRRINFYPRPPRGGRQLPLVN